MTTADEVAEVERQLAELTPVERGWLADWLDHTFGQDDDPDGE